MRIIEDFEHFHYFTFKTGFLGHENLFQKTASSVFQLKVLRLKTQHIHIKLPGQKLMLRQIEWGVPNGPITKNGVLPETTSFF